MTQPQSELEQLVRKRAEEFVELFQRIGSKDYMGRYLSERSYGALFFEHDSKKKQFAYAIARLTGDNDKSDKINVDIFSENSEGEDYLVDGIKLLWREVTFIARTTEYQNIPGSSSLSILLHDMMGIVNSRNDLAYRIKKAQKCLSEPEED